MISYLKFLTFFNKYFFGKFLVGGGSAGSAVASRLAENPAVSVLLLEAGGKPNPFTYIPSLAPDLLIPSITFQYSTVPQQRAAFGSINRSVLWPRGRGLGGSSNANFMTYNRGNPNDFDRWAQITGDWRWSFKSVLKYFLKMEDYHGSWDDGAGNMGYHSKGGPVRIEQAGFAPSLAPILMAAEEMGYPIRDPNALQTPGFSPIDFTQVRGTRWNTYRGYLEQSEILRPNLHILRYAQVTQIQFDPDMRAIGVAYQRHGIYHIAGANKEIILSAGSIASPQLLMLSGIGPREHLEEVGIPTLVDIPAVGQNLQDHVLTWIGPFLVKPKASYIPDRDFNLKSLAEYMTRGTGPLSTPLSVTAFGMTSTPETTPNWPNILWSMHPRGVHRSLGQSLDTTFNSNNRQLHKFLKKYRGHDAHFVMQSLGLPRSVGYLRLRDANPDSYPIIDPRYYSDPADLSAMAHGIQEIVHIYENSPSLGAGLQATLAPDKIPGCEHLEHRSIQYWECLATTVTGTLYHPAGTCAMGKPGSPGTVVDSQLRVVGTTGLRVADCSVMPKVTKYEQTFL